MERLSDTSILLDRVQAALAGHPVVQRRMFGGHTFLLNGNMLCCVSDKGLMARVGASAEAVALKRPFAARCIGSGREMAGFLLVAREGVARDHDLQVWLDLALDYVGGIPPKRPRGKARGRAKAASGR